MKALDQEWSGEKSINNEMGANSKGKSMQQPMEDNPKDIDGDGF